MNAAPPVNSNALQVLRARYLRRDAAGRTIETPAALFERVASAVAEAERAYGHADGVHAWAERFNAAMAALDFLPNSPTLMNAGTPHGQLSGCYVLPVEDSLEEIFSSLQLMAQIQRTGGGTGFSFSRLRARGDPVHGFQGKSSGPVPFIRVFDAATDAVRQGGRRRGANMAVLRVDHPDIEEFIGAKRNGGLQNFNISVAATDTFMERVDAGQSYALIDPRTGEVVTHRSAARVFDRIRQAAWTSGDPGLLFIDAINRANPTPELGRIEATNPCGEIPLLPFESCNLGSINLAHLLTGGAPPEIDWDRLGRTTRLAVRFLDDVIDVNRFPVRASAEMTRGNRKIGLGVMGFADLLIALGIPYASDEAATLATQIMSTIEAAAWETSLELGETRGPFPNWARSRYARSGDRLRNAQRTAIAPTGSISLIAGVSPGIEPLFALAHRRRAIGGVLEEVHPQLERAMRARGLPDEVLSHVRSHGNLGGVDGSVPSDLRHLFQTALEIEPARHLGIQAAFQRHTDAAVSKTINLPADATPDTVGATFHEAWTLGLKGVTIYRYGSHADQVLSLGVNSDTEAAHVEEQPWSTCGGTCLD